MSAEYHCLIHFCGQDPAGTPDRPRFSIGSLFIAWGDIFWGRKVDKIYSDRSINGCVHAPDTMAMIYDLMDFDVNTIELN
jgi:hypothetical protein